MEAVFFWTSLLILVGLVLIGVEVFLGVRRLAWLRDTPPLTGTSLPRVSVIIPARNEERHLEEALESVLHLDYPDYEIVVLDDRSTDRTPDILRSLGQRHPRLRSARIETLPDGWIGKNHALWVGAERSTGEYLLFTDADVVMEPSVLRRAMALVMERKLDHLTIAPFVVANGVLLKAFMPTFAIFFALFTRPWRASNPKSRFHIGLGAFNLVSSHAYLGAGTHARIALRPDDDLKLGKIIKTSGFRQDVAFTTRFLRVEWYASISELIRGLEKNSFSGVDYSLAKIVLGTSTSLVLFVGPYLAVCLTSDAAFLFNLASVGVLSALYYDQARHLGLAVGYLFFFPVCVVLFVYILWRATLLNLCQGGIRWRGTFYPLKELKRNKV